MPNGGTEQERITGLEKDQQDVLKRLAVLESHVEELRKSKPGNTKQDLTYTNAELQKLKETTNFLSSEVTKLSDEIENHKYQFEKDKSNILTGVKIIVGIAAGLGLIDNLKAILALLQ